MLFTVLENDKYTVVGTYNRDIQNNEDEVLEAETVKISTDNSEVYGRVKESNMGHNKGWWITRKDLIDVKMGLGSYLLEVQ